MKFVEDPSQNYNGIAAGVGTTIFGGEPYLLFHLAPQFKLGEFGIGIDGNIRIGQNGKFREEDFDETYDLLRWINYLSYGKQRDTIYARIGGLTRATIGNGTIIGGYSNNSSYDDRRIGLAAALRLGPVGAEALTSDLFRKGLLAARPYLHPFQLVPGLSGVNILRELQIGVTGSFDFDTNATRIIPNREPFVSRIAIDTARDSLVINSVIKRPAPLTIVGLDLTTMLFDNEYFTSRAYADYVKIVNFNDGVIFGLSAGVKFGEHMIDLRAERSLFRNGFLPNYYNSFYERDRYDTHADTNDYITKLTLLEDSTTGNGNGVKIGGFFSFDKVLQGSLTYLHLDNLPGRDWMDIYFSLPEIWYGFTGGIGYSRKNIEGPEDIFALDNRSLLQARFSVPLLGYFYGTVNARWTFDRDEAGKITTQSMIEPRVDFVFKF